MEKKGQHSYDSPYFYLLHHIPPSLGIPLKRMPQSILYTCIILYEVPKGNFLVIDLFEPPQADQTTLRQS